MIPQATVDLILDTAQIADIVGDFVTLKRRGANLVACCPFHNEKTPSFYVSPSKGIYKCFGCGKAGSAVGFVMEHEHCTYVEALRYLARRYNIEVQEEEESAEVIAARQHSESLMLVSEFAQKFFVQQLQSQEGKALGLAYYHSRGLEDETIAKFGLGWAPSGRTALHDAAIAAGYKEEYLVDAGLCIRTDDGRVLDKFYERVTFPIHSISGRVIAYSCRTLRSDNPAKYVNSPETEIYTKSRILYGIWFAKQEISRQDKCILVEGNLDMVSMHQIGFTNVVASCGTSLTIEQIRLMHKFTDNVTIMYDGDSAGIHAALRGIGMVLEEGMNVRVVLLPDGDDPDSFSRKNTLEQIREFISANERDFIGFKTDLLLSEAGSDPLKRAGLINDIADTISQIPDAVKRSVYVEDCAAKFKISSDVLFQRISATRLQKQEAALKAEERERRREEQQAPVQVQPAVQVTSLKNSEVVERDLLSFMLNYGLDELVFETDSEYYREGEPNPTVAEFISASLESDGTQFQNPVFKAAYDMYLDLYDRGYDQSSIIRHMASSQNAQLAQIASDLSTEKYELTVKNLAAALTTTDSWLANHVPNTLMVYAGKRIEDRIKDLTQGLRSLDADALIESMKEIKRLQVILRKINQKTGRERII